MRIIALDLSLTETGWASHVWLGTGIYGPSRAGVMKPPRSDGSGMRRLSWFRGQVRQMCRHYDPAVVVIEGYAYGMARGASQQHSLGELGGVVRLALHDLRIPYVDVAPASLKKYAVGKGNAKKEEVLVAAVKRLGYHGSNHNVADAMWLRQMAADHYGAEGAVPMPKAQRAALEAGEWPAITANEAAAVAAGGVG
jgi:Holliday junction resolvasome RuvABC endonuclease subunit